MSGRTVMRCKLKMHSKETLEYAGQSKDAVSVKVKFGAVWEGSSEKQLTENAAFGAATPQAEFAATIKNRDVVDVLVPGRSYYVTFTEVDEPKPAE